MTGRKAVFVILVVAFCTSALAQKNEASISVGAVVTSDQQARNGVFPCPANLANCGPFTLTTDTGIAFEGDYARDVFNFHGASLGAEFPIVGVPGRTLTTRVSSGQPTSIPLFINSQSAVFFTPSARIKLLPSRSLSPFLSIGGGLAHYGAGLGASVNRGALQFGGGVDFKTPLSCLAIRAEARDFFGKRFPDSTSGLLSPERLHNVFAGVGLVFKF